MNREQLIKKIAKEFQADEIAVAELVDAIFDTLALTLSKGKNVTISEFGRFRVQKKRDGDCIIKKLIFTPVKKFADQVNKNYNNLPIVKLRVIDSKSKDSIPEVGEKEFIYIMEDEVIISADMFEEIDSEVKPSLTQESELSTISREKEFLQEASTMLTNLEETTDTTQKAPIITDEEMQIEIQPEDKDFPTIEETLLSDTSKEDASTHFELKEVVKERQKILDEITELEEREKELSSLATLEKLSRYNVDDFDISEKTFLDNNELIALIGEDQNIFLIKEETSTQQQPQFTHTDSHSTTTEDELLDELKILEEEISNLPSIDIVPETKVTQTLEESDKKASTETTELPEDTISSLEDAFEEIKFDKQTEENPPLSENNNKAKDFSDSPFKPIDYTPSTTQEELKSQTLTTKSLNETQEKKFLNPYLKLAIVFLLIFLLLIFIAILF